MYTYSDNNNNNNNNNNHNKKTKIRSLFTSWKLGSIKKSKYGFGEFSGSVFK